METWIISIFTFLENQIAYILTFALGYVAGVYLPNKFRKEDRKPKISIGQFQERQNFFDITNHGGDILKLKIIISWLDNGVKKEREMKNFFNSSEDPAFGKSHLCNVLKKGETKKVIDCPAYSDDERVNIYISGTDISGKEYKDEAVLINIKKS